MRTLRWPPQQITDNYYPAKARTWHGLFAWDNRRFVCSEWNWRFITARQYKTVSWWITRSIFFFFFSFTPHSPSHSPTPRVIFERRRGSYFLFRLLEWVCYCSFRQQQYGSWSRLTIFDRIKSRLIAFLVYKDIPRIFVVCPIVFVSLQVSLWLQVSPPVGVFLLFLHRLSHQE